MSSVGNVIFSNSVVNPVPGTVVFDTTQWKLLIYNGSQWLDYATNVQPDSVPEFVVPTAEEFEKYPAMKIAWDNFLEIRRLCGVR